MSQTIRTNKIIYTYRGLWYHRVMSKKIDYNLRLQNIYKWSVGIYSVLAVASLWFMNKATYQLTWGFLAKDELVSKQSAVLVPGSQSVIDVQVRCMLAVILALSIVVPYLYIAKIQKQHKKQLKNRVMPLRWLDLAISSALMMQVIAILSGVTDILTLKMIAILMVITGFLGWLAERQATEAKKLVLPTFIAGVVAGSYPWILIAGYAIATPLLAAVRAPWYVYALYAASLSSFVLIAINQYRYNQKYKQWKDYIYTEQNYAAISLLSKTAFAIILIIGLKK